jgi:hypothetical protein
MVIEDVIPTGKFNKSQLELLKVFSKQFPEKVWIDIKNLIANYFMDEATKEMDQLFEDNNWGVEKIEEWADTHMRTKYNPLIK